VSLGIEVLYLTPLFLSQSAHRYDTDDYFLIDPLLGHRRICAAHRRTAPHGSVWCSSPCSTTAGRVFSPSRMCWKKVWPPGMRTGSSSTNSVDMQKKNYATFASAANMPKLNAAHPDVRDYLCQVGRYWIRETDIDGWRIDVANEVDPTFWRHFRTPCGTKRPTPSSSGEIWGDATFWLGGDMFDGVMHYPFTFAVKSHSPANKTCPVVPGKLPRAEGRIRGTDPGAAHRRHMGDLVSLDHQLKRIGRHVFRIRSAMQDGHCWNPMTPSGSGPLSGRTSPPSGWPPSCSSPILARRWCIMVRKPA
jgi:hypothetical protein